MTTLYFYILPSLGDYDDVGIKIYVNPIAKLMAKFKRQHVNNYWSENTINMLQASKYKSINSIRQLLEK